MPALDPFPTLTIFGGPNGAGKSTLRALMERRRIRTGAFVNADLIAERLDASVRNREVAAGREAVRQATAYLASGQSFAQKRP